MTLDISELFAIIFYILLVVLIVSLIVLVINAIKTLNKVDRLVDDISQKSNKLNGVFEIVDSATDAVVGFSDGLVSFVAGTVDKLFNRKKVKNYGKK